MSHTELQERLAAYIAARSGVDRVRVTGFRQLPGGAIQENYGIEVEIPGGERPGRLSLVLRTDSDSAVAVSMSRGQEFAVLRKAFEAGVMAPEPLWLCEDPAVIGKDFYLMRRAEGIASGRALVRSELDATTREHLVEHLGRQLARLHRILPPEPSLGFLDVPRESPAHRRVAQYRAYLDALPEPQPVLEWALGWLAAHAPRETRVTFTHGDYRTGNYLVHDGELTAILDWEFAGWSDPMEDLGWFCARCWRFGAWDREAGGIGSREAFYRGYAAENGAPVDAGAVPYWEVMATVRWAVIALQQAERHLSGEQPSLELALTGRMVPELEYDIFAQIERLEGEKP